MIRFAAIATAALLLAAANASAGTSDEPEYSDGNGVSAGQSQTYDRYAHGNGSLGTLSQSDMSRFVGDGEQRRSDARDDDARSDDDADTDDQADIRGDAREDSGADAPYASDDRDSTIGRSSKAAVSDRIAKFNPADFIALADMRGPDLVGADVEDKSGHAIGHVRNTSSARGRVASVTVDLDDGRNVKIGADKLRYNKKGAFLLTNLDQPELEQLAGD